MGPPPTPAVRIGGMARAPGEDEGEESTTAALAASGRHVIAAAAAAASAAAAVLICPPRAPPPAVDATSASPGRTMDGLASCAPGGSAIFVCFGGRERGAGGWRGEKRGGGSGEGAEGTAPLLGPGVESEGGARGLAWHARQALEEDARKERWGAPRARVRSMPDALGLSLLETRRRGPRGGARGGCVVLANTLAVSEYLGV